MIQDYFRDSFDVLRKMDVIDPGGAVTEGEDQLILKTTGRMRPLSGKEIYINEKRNYKTTHRFYCPFGDVQANDLVHDTVNDIYYEVKLPINPMEFGEFIQADVNKLDANEVAIIEKIR